MKRSYSRAIVPYVASSNKYARVGMALGNYAWRNRKSIVRGAKKMAKMYRKRTTGKYARRFVGIPNSKTKNESNMINTLHPSLGHRQLGYTVLSQFPTGTIIAEDGRRNSNKITFTGVKICFDFTHKLDWGGGGRPYRLHFAIAQQKIKGAGIGNIRTEFFVDKTQATESYLDFTDAGATSPFDKRYDCCPLNRDRMNILTHIKRIVRPPPVPGTGGLAVCNTGYNVRIEKYLSLKKRIEFQNMSATVNEFPLFACWWFQAMNGTDVPVNQATSLMDVESFNRVYYKT